MLDRCCRVLLVEDDPEDTETIQKLLANAQSASFQKGFELVCTETLREGRERLARGNIDVVLLDLMLPDSRGVSTLVEIQKVAPNVPVIVQTVIEDEAISVKVLELGACGYLAKLKLDAKLLVYALRSAMERHYQLAALEQLQNRQQEQEIRKLEQLMTGSLEQSQPTASIAPVRDRMPDIFEELVQRYSDFIEQALEQRVYKIETQLSEQLSIFAEQLGVLKAAPRDVVEIHTQVLKQKIRAAAPGKAQAYTKEGRFLLLELLGNLASYYRRYFIGLDKLNLSKQFNELKHQ
jgi:DNA-binding response OmpR family regulator